MSTILERGARVVAARAVAGMLLDDLPDRWRHTIGVAERAEELSVTVDSSERDVLVAAAWLHDIGYSPKLYDTGFHPVDGAAYLRRHGWSERLAGLVAYHSGAEFMARARGLSEALWAYPRERSPLADALTYADQSTGPVGQRLPIRVRMAEMLARHGAASVQAQVHGVRGPYLLAVAERVEARLAET